MPPEVLAPWIAEGGQHAAPEAAQEGSILRMFSSNDYMGLSTHPAVRQAAADAALLYGMGARIRMLAACSGGPVPACAVVALHVKPPEALDVNVSAFIVQGQA